MDPGEFHNLALRELEPVYRWAFHLTRRADEAEELVQETYLRALKACATVTPRGNSLRPWLFKIARNVLYARLNRTKLEPTLDGELDARSAPANPRSVNSLDGLAGLDWENVDERLKQAIDELPTAYREVLLLWAVEDLKYREIAEVLEIAVGTVMSRLFRARAMLMEKLADLAAEQGLSTVRMKLDEPGPKG